ncbi:60S ribosomal protein L27-like protein, partial [Tanacetum coccineum]
MTSVDEIREASLKDTKVKVVKGKPRKPHRGVKVSTPGSAGAGSILRHTRSAKVSGKSRVRAEESLDDNRGGKRAANSPMNDEISKVLSGLRSGSFNSNLKFSMGHSVDVSNPVCSLNHEIDANVDCNVNDGYFINRPLENSVLNEQCSPVAKSRGPKTSLDHFGMGDDGIASDKGGSGFEFGKNVNSDGILKKPIGPVFNVQFSNVVKINPFGMSSNGKCIGRNNGGWNASFGNKFGPTVLSNQYFVVVDSKTIGREEYSLLLRKLLRGAKLVLCNCMGILWFKSKDGMKKVLESGPWMVQNVPLGLNMREPRIWLDKTEPSVIPIWVCVPMELCNGNGIGKIMSGVGKPLLMDNMKKERCLKKSGKLDFAKVLVEVFANDNLPSSLEISYPPIGNRPAKVGVLN